VSQALDAIVIGGGSNGLTAATALARGGLRVTLLERAEALGGQRRSVEFAPGFHAAPLALDPGWAPPEVSRLLGLEGLSRTSHDAPISVLAEDGESLTLWRDPARADEAIRRFSAVDATAWPAFVQRLHKLAGFLEVLYRQPAPDVDAPAAELLSLFGLARRFRGLGGADSIEFLRTLPMSVWELLDDTFKSEVLKAAVAPSGVLDHAQGPRSGGTGFVLLHHLTGAPAGAVRGRAPWRDGPDTFARAAEAAARRAGVDIRTGAEVARIDIKGDAAQGVTLASGEAVTARRVLSTASPAHTLLDWVDPVWLDPEILRAAGNLRFRGCTSFVLYALESLPAIPGLPAQSLAGAVALSPSVVAIERAADATKYGRLPERPHIELSVPTLNDPGASPGDRHVLVARAQYAPHRLRDGGTWDDARRQALGETIDRAVAAAIPGFAAHVLHRAVWSPLDLEERFGLTGGAPSHGELGLDQILFMRPLPGWGRYASPISGLYWGGAGCHPGPGVLGGAGWLAARRILEDRNA
jgi:phytoene dehydrogenase-like protein